MSTQHIINTPREKISTEPSLPSWLELVRQQVSSLKFGTVQITVHDSRITQVERLEKVRLDREINPTPKSA